MQTETPAPPPLNTGHKTYITLPPEVEVEPRFSFAFIVFTLVVLGGATCAGLVKSGRVSLGKETRAATQAPVPAPAASPVSTAAPVAHSAPASVIAAVVHAVVPAATPAPVLKPDTFAVTSISLGAQSIAIINGVARQVGDAAEAPGVTGWTVYRIDEDKVWLRNGPTISAIELTTPGMNALNDTLHPLN